MNGFVYLLHFDRPISPDHTTQHYLGWSRDLAARIQQHECGSRARLLQVARQRGIRFRVVRVWRGGPDLEKRLKRRKESPRLCPCCSNQPRPVGGYNELTPAQIADALIPF